MDELTMQQKIMIRASLFLDSLKLELIPQISVYSMASSYAG
jgi:hypothetical protein